MSRGRPLKTRTALLLAGALAGLACGETVLRLVEFRSQADSGARTRELEDPRLGRRPGPLGTGHDEWGFRNERVPRAAEIVAIGDSQTWGVNASRAEAWPQRLQAITGRTTYNMSWGGFGTVHYRVLAEEAQALSPRVFVVGLYFGNDFYDSYRIVYASEAHASLRIRDPSTILPDTVGPRAGALWREHEEFQLAYGRDRPERWGLWLRGHTAVGRLLDRALGSDQSAWFEIGKAWARAHPDHGAFIDAPDARTVFTTAYRLLAVNLEDPRIVEGLRLTEVSLGTIADLAARRGGHLLVVLIPTKERVYAERMRAEGRALDPTYAALVAQEEECGHRVEAFLLAAGIEQLDLIPHLRSAVVAGNAVYPPTTESHPSPRGYDVIAEAVARRLGRLGW
jgi:hypothetical protein